MSVKKMNGFMACCLLALPLLAAAEGEAQPAATGDVVTPKPKLICTLERSTGSNIPRKICLTQEQRDAIREQNQQVLRDAHMNTPVSRQ